MQVMVREGRKVKASGKRFTDIAESKADEKIPERRASQSKRDMSDDENDGYKNEGKRGSKWDPAY